MPSPNIVQCKNCGEWLDEDNSEFEHLADNQFEISCKVCDAKFIATREDFKKRVDLRQNPFNPIKII